MDGGGAVAGTSLGEGGNGRQTAGRADWDGRSVARPDRQADSRAGGQPCPPAGRADSLVGRADGRAGGRQGGRSGGLIDGRPPRADSLVGRADGRAGGRPCGRRGGLIDGRPGARTGGQAGGHTHS